MVGFYNKAEQDAPPLVRFVDRVLAHRNALLLAAVLLLAALLALSIVLPRLGLTLLAVAVVGILAGVLIVRSQGRYRTHWTRDAHRR